MGYLTITPLSTDTTATSLPSSSAHVEHPSQLEPVIAEIKIGQEVYRYAISGISFEDIEHIPLLPPSLVYAFFKVIYSQTGSSHPNYGAIRQLTFYRDKKSSESTIMASSFRALANLLEDVIKKRGSNIKTLVIDDNARCHMKTTGMIFKSGYELLPLTFPKIQPFHFIALTSLEVTLANTSTIIINGINDLLGRGCFANLKSLQFPLTGLRVWRHKKGWIGFLEAAEQQATKKLLTEGFMQAKLSFLEELRLPLWLADGAQAGLLALRQVYPTLKKLVVDSMCSTAIPIGAQVAYQIEDSYTSQGYRYTYTMDHYGIELEIPTQSEEPTLFSVLQEMKDQSQLEWIEIHDNPVHEKKGISHGQCDYKVLTQLILNNALPKLNSISIQPSEKYHLVDQEELRKEIIDTTELLHAVVGKNIPLKHLQLAMPEQQGFQPWLDYMAEYGFPELVYFHYRVPRKLKVEAEEVYETRIEKAFLTILNAITSNKLPSLSSLIIMGFGNFHTQLDEKAIPPRFRQILIDIEDAVAKQRNNFSPLSPIASSSAAPSDQLVLDEDLADFEMI